jgi:voltage-gated potassium channel Kch
VAISATRAVVSYIGSNNSNSGELAIVDIVDAAPSLVHTGILYAPSLFYNCLCKNSLGRIIVHFRDVNYFNTGAAILGLVGADDISFYETTGRAIAGVAMDAGSADDVIRIYTGKNVNFLTGLTPGHVYYAHSDGTLDNSNAQKDNADAPTLFGTAISSTQLLKQ